MKKNILVNGISTYVELTQDEVAEIEVQKNSSAAKLHKIEMLKEELAKLDYIGVKIATGRATREEYSEQIEKMNQLAEEINKLKSELN